MKVEVRFRRTFQVKPYETEAIEFCVWEDLNVNDGFERKVTTEKILQSHMEKVIEFKAQMFHVMAEKVNELMAERLQQGDPRDVVDPVRRR